MTQKTKNKYDTNSEFDIDKHAEYFTNYLEDVIGRKGKVFYAVPSHTMFLENTLKTIYGENVFNEMLKEPDSFVDYSKWLCEKTGCVLVWDDFYICSKRGLTSEQIKTLQALQNKKYKLGGLALYRGNI